MPQLRSASHEQYFRRLFVGIYLLATLLFAWQMAQQWSPEYGFSRMLYFGSRFAPDMLPAVAQTEPFIYQNSPGYDAQFYAQMAVDPLLRDPALNAALDDASYRARRILFSATAYLLGLGDPEWIIQAYVIQGMLAWLLMAALLLHWLPPTGWQNTVRWCGVMFSAGMLFSVNRALNDAPASALILLALYAMEHGRTKLSVLLLAISTLGRETNLIAGAVFVPLRKWRPGTLPRLLVTGLCLALPLLIWLAYMVWGSEVTLRAPLGRENFTAPLAGLAHRWGNLDWSNPLDVRVGFDLIAIGTQMAFFLFLSRERDSHWWKLGVIYTALAIFLGTAVWEGFPIAATRALIPMQIAFNILVPKDRRYIPLLLAGNLSVLNAPILFTG